MSVKMLVQAAVENGVPALAITNINSTCDLWDFVMECRAENIKPLVGVEIWNDNQLLYILLAANNTGLNWINEFLSSHLMEEKPFPASPIEKHFFNNLTDGFDIKQLDSIRSCIEKVSGVKEIKEIRARANGNNILIDVIVGVSADLSVIQGHDITEGIEGKLRSEFNITDVVVHVEPEI